MVQEGAGIVGLPRTSGSGRGGGPVASETSKLADVAFVPAEMCGGEEGEFADAFVKEFWMNKVTKLSWLAAVVLGMSAATVTLPTAALAEKPSAGAVALVAQKGAGNDQVALVEQLKSEALQQLREGQLTKTSELFSQAVTRSNDPVVAKMAGWVKDFDSQHQQFSAERKKEYDKAAAQVKLLDANGYTDYAVDAMKLAYVLAEDKKAFANEPWAAGLLKRAVTMANEYERTEHWVKAVRLYSDLGGVEPANPEWKDRLKVATRRVRLLALYAPGEFKHLQESEESTRKAARKLLADANLLDPEEKKAATQPSEKDDKAESFKIDWHDTLQGVQMDMLKDALFDARGNYYREVSYKMLAQGGLAGVRAVATTKGLENAFSGLADPEKKAAFLAAVDDGLARAQAATVDGEREMLRSVLRKVQQTNEATVKLPDEVLVSEFADGAFAELDPFSSMIWPSDLEEFNKTTQGEFSGVGIQIESDEDGSLKVASPLEDTPAYKAGIKAGDIIAKIDGKTAKGISLNQAVRSITGRSGTPVVLTVRSANGTTKDYTIIRQTIKVASVKGWQHRPGGGWDYFVDPENKIGYLRMTNFTKTTSEELDRAVRDMQGQGAKGLILDLRYNPGGLLNAATEVSDKFLHGGDIVSTHADRKDTPNQPTVAMARDDEDDVRYPVVVLVNQYSASASEIVSGALKDQKRALIVGERTFGKGSVQMLFPLSDRAAMLKLTTSHYYLPSGRCIHREENSTEWGVDPDVTIEMTPEQMRAAIDARKEMDVLRDAQAAPAEGTQEKLNDKAQEVKDAVTNAAAKDAKKGKDPLACDPQLSAGLLLLRLQLAGTGAS
jgi:carboxyl-terminal processing protease